MASGVAKGMLHQAMYVASHWRISEVVKIGPGRDVFFIALPILLLTIIAANDHSIKTNIELPY